ncbi:MAG: hypothetical protein IKC26_04110 [Clostridia bacterium]|nr:hypothetical protein [Clostridia bacterium]
MARKKEKKSESQRTASPVAAMRDLFRKLQSESEAPSDSAREEKTDKAPAPKYDEDRAVSTRRQLMADYRKELEALGREEKRTASRSNLYEYEDLTPETEEAPAEIVEILPVSDEEFVDEEMSIASEAVEEAAEAEEIIPDVIEEAAEAEETTPEVVEEAAEAEEIIPEVVEEAAEAEETTPDVIEEAAEGEEIIPEVVEEAAEAEETTPDVIEEAAEAEEIIPEVVEEAAEAEETTPDVIEEAAEAKEIIPETVEEAAEAEEIIPETEKEISFRAVMRPDNADARKPEAARRPEPSKQKDPYNVYDYDMAQEFGYIPESRERTVSQVNELGGVRDRHVTVYTKQNSSSRKSGKRNLRYGRTVHKKNGSGDDTRSHARAGERSFTGETHKRTIKEPERISEREDARIRENPKKAKEIALRRVILTGVIAVILCFWEYLPLLPGGQYMPFGLIGNTQYPFLYIGLAALLLVLDLALIGRALLPSLRELFTLRCTPRSLAVFAVMLAFLNDLCSCYILLFGSDAEYGMFHYPAALCVLFYTVGVYATVCRKIDAYAVFDAMRPKYLLTEDELCEHIRNRAALDDDGGRVRCFSVTGNVQGVERRLGSEERYDGFPGFRRLFFLLALVGMLAMTVSALRSVGEGSMLGRAADAVNIFFWTLFLSMPLAVTELRRLPLLRVSDRMRKRNTALAGDAAALEYVSLRTVAVRSEMFFRKHPFCLGECAGSDPERLKYYLSSILMSLGEPFSRAVNSEYSERVKLLHVSSHTVRAYVDGVLVELRLGDDEHVGYRLSDPGASLRESAYRLPLGIAVEGETVGTCSLYVQNDAEYPALVRALFDHGLRASVCHYTFLPFLTEKTLQIPNPGSKKKKPPLVQNMSEDTVAARLQSSAIRDGVADSGIAALNAPRDLWIPLVYADKITAYNRFSAILAWISVITGASLALLTAFGILPVVANPILVSALPIGFGLISYLFSNYYLS